MTWLRRLTEDRLTPRRVEGNDFTKPLVSVVNPSSAAAEAYRTLRTNLFYAFPDDYSKSIVLTSPSQYEGKSITCANLGVVLAQAGKNTLIIDSDLRMPSLHRLFGLRNLWGVVDVIRGERPLQEVWSEPLEGLKVVPAGTIPHNPAELLGSRRFTELAGRARQAFDYVLIDSPPTGLFSDPATLATQGDGVLLVLDAQNTRKSSVRRCIRSLEAVGANILGTVMNKPKSQRTATTAMAMRTSEGLKWERTELAR